MNRQPASYHELAWTETILARPEDHVDEAGIYIRQLQNHVKGEAGRLLHLGCGAGCLDHTFKRHFAVTGVDLSEDMLAIARATNPEVRYVQGDMRDVDLEERFDAVAIPDAIDYMATLSDLRLAITTACRHLRHGGVLLIVAKVREEFRENNFCYTGARDGVEITVFENNYIPSNDPARYEATLVYLIRRDGELSIHTDRHQLGMFSQAEWAALFREAGLELRQEPLDGLYHPYLLGEGVYPMRVFVGIRLR